MKKGLFFILLVVILVGILCIVGGNKMEEKNVFRTETAPIYNHFPDLPETSQMQWYSVTSEGIGLSTTKLYIFAFYDKDICEELQEMNFETEGADLEFDFAPDEVDGNQKWRYADQVYFAFQSGIADDRRMNTKVYINEEGTILYIEAISD